MQYDHYSPQSIRHDLAQLEDKYLALKEALEAEKNYAETLASVIRLLWNRCREAGIVQVEAEDRKAGIIQAESEMRDS